MKALPWIVAGVGFGLAAYFLLNQPSVGYVEGRDDVEDASMKSKVWGTTKRVEGTGGGLVGQVKQGLGEVTGDKKLQADGLADQAVGAVKDTVGQAAHAVGQTLHELNK